MICHLELKNILLFESLKISLGSGLSILTGETGAGKSIIFSVLGWILGEKVDVSPVREGEKVGSIEALFDIKNNPCAQKCLKQEGIEFQEKLLVRREFSINGKSRIFINDQNSSLSFLRTLGSTLAEKVGQNAHKELFSFSSQLALLDLFGGLEKEVENFSFQWAHLKEIEHRLAERLSQKEKKGQEEERLKTALKEIEELSYKPQEENQLCQEEKILRRSREVEEKVHAIIDGLSDGNPSLLFGLKNILSLLSSIADISSSFNDNLLLLQNAMIEVEEVLYSLRQFQSRFSYSPERLEQIEERLSHIFKIRRKHGNSEEALLSFQKEAKERLQSLENLEETANRLQEEADSLQKSCGYLAALLSEKRKKTAVFLEKRVNEELPLLNMENALFSIDFQKKERSETGDEEITFFLKANTGEKTAPLSLSASGGELSRICFALKILLSEKNRTPLLLFDEIDANVGGRTATIIGEKLKELSEKKQVFAITHFVQVAHFATTHLFVQKQENNGRTISSVKELSEEDKEMEYTRMMGKLYHPQNYCSKGSN